MTMKLIASVTATNVLSFDFTNIPQNATDLYMVIALYSSSTTAYQDVKIQAGTTAGSLSDLTNAVYSQGNGSTVSNNSASSPNVGIVSHTNSGLGAFSTGTIYIADYANTTYNKQFNYDFASMRINSSGFIRKGANSWANTGAIGKLSVASTNSTTLNGTVSLYSITKGSDGTALTV